MSKDAMQRLTDTVTFIANNRIESLTTEEQHEEIVDELNAWLRRKPESKKTQLSGLMALDGSGNKNDRHRTRAAVMMDCALSFPESQWTTQATSLKSMGKVNASQTMKSAYERAFDSVYSQPTNVRLMLAELRANPLTVMRNFKLSINGGSKTGNPLTYSVKMYRGVYKFDCYMTDGYQITAMNVAATKYSEVKDSPGAITPVSSAVHEGSDLLLTTQFTGCSFCFMKSPDGSNMLAAHIDPGKSKTFSGSDLSKIMRESGGFSETNGGAMKAYGRVKNNSGLFGYPESAGQMIIVGIRHGTDWRLYSQITNLDGSLVAQRIDNQ